MIPKETRAQPECLFFATPWIQMRLPNVLAASVLALSALGAHAEGIVTIDVSSGSAFFGNTPANVADWGFLDFYQFTVGQASNLSATVTTAQNGAQDIDNLSAQLSGPSFHQDFIRITDDPFELLGFSAFLNSPGTYTLAVMGRQNSAVLASYSGTIGIAVVPEPGSLALMLAGLGTVALLMKRRSGAWSVGAANLTPRRIGRQSSAVTPKVAPWAEAD